MVNVIVCDYPDLQPGARGKVSQSAASCLPTERAGPGHSTPEPGEQIMFWPTSWGRSFDSTCTGTSNWGILWKVGDPGFGSMENWASFSGRKGIVSGFAVVGSSFSVTKPNIWDPKVLHRLRCLLSTQSTLEILVGPDSHNVSQKIIFIFIKTNRPFEGLQLWSPH